MEEPAKSQLAPTRGVAQLTTTLVVACFGWGIGFGAQGAGPIRVPDRVLFNVRVASAAARTGCPVKLRPDLKPIGAEFTNRNDAGRVDPQRAVGVADRRLAGLSPGSSQSV